VNYDYRRRNYFLPHGCKNLIDALKFDAFNHAEDIALIHKGEQGNEYTIKFKMPGLRTENIEIIAEGRNLRVSRQLSNKLVRRQIIVEIPLGYEIAKARAKYIKDTLHISIPKRRIA
jgi:HSP20 family molecular chaperone IbpA